MFAPKPSTARTGYGVPSRIESIVMNPVTSGGATVRGSRRPGRTRVWSPGDAAGACVLGALAALALVILVGPLLVVVLVSFDARQYIGFPPDRLSLRWYTALWRNAQLIDAAKVSLRVALDVTLIGVALGVPAAYALVRGRFRGRTEAGALLLAPQMMPGLVIGVAVVFFGHPALPLV